MPFLPATRPSAVPWLIAISLSLLLAGCVGTATESTPGANASNCSLNDPAYANGIGINTTTLANLQDGLFSCIADNQSFDNARALALLDSFLPDYSTGISALDRMNPLYSNNLAIRNDLLRMLLMQRQNASYVPKASAFASVMAKIHDFGFTSGNDSSWLEGSGYLLYTLPAVEEADERFNYPPLQEFQNESENWLEDFALPDGTLAPIGDTQLDTAYTSPKTGPLYSDRMIYTDEETAIFFDNGSGYLLFRHPVNDALPATDIRNDLHTQFDFGAVYLWYNGTWIIRPIGYPGYDMKTADDLDDKYDYNIQSADRIGGDFTQADFDSLNLMSYLDSWRFGTAAIVQADAVQRDEYADSYELTFSYALNTGPGGSYENYTRTLILYKGQKELEIIDDEPASASSYLMVSDGVNVTSASGVSCNESGEWSPAWGVVQSSRRCAIGPGTALDYSVQWQ